MPGMSESTTAGIPDWPVSCPRCRSELTNVRVRNELTVDVETTETLIHHHEHRTKRCHCTFCSMNWNERLRRTWAERKDEK